MATKLIPLTCNKCGAPLSVPTDVRFVTCAHCQTSLSIEHEGDTFFTRQIEQLTERTEEIHTKLSSMERKIKLQQLEQDWERDERAMMIERKDGNPTLPKRADSPGSIFGIVMAGVVLFGFVAFASQMPGGFGPLVVGFGLIVGIGIVIGAASEHDKAIRYESAKRRYKLARAELLKEIDDDSGH